MSTQYKQTETFDATAPITVDEVKIEWVRDDSPDLSWLTQRQADSKPAFNVEKLIGDVDALKYAAQDKDRLDAYNRGDWYMQGCVAKATVSRPIGQGSRRLETFTSGGLWGIESDSDPAYFNEVEKEQLADLAEHLNAFGIEVTAEQLREIRNNSM